jgi:peptidyl-prolyl cis-trans isomerase C
MFARKRGALMGCVLLFCAGVVLAQPGTIPPPKQLDPPPPRDLIAARVNGQAIPELAVYRALMRLAPERREQARKDVLSYLIDNTIVDQYLSQLKIPVAAKDVDDHVAKIKKEANDEKKDFKKLLEELFITEDELRTELTGALRWDKFVLQQGTEKALSDFFKANPRMFDGSQVQARHILLPKSSGSDGVAKLVAIKKEIEAEVAVKVAKLPPGADAFTREKERAKAIDKAFSDAAAKHSTCPSKKEGGDLGFFPRAGAMVEPFAAAAFALKPFQMTDPIATEFGYHLILAIDQKPGKVYKFEERKPLVQEIYGERLREAVLTAYRAKSKIEIVERVKK